MASALVALFVLDAVQGLNETMKNSIFDDDHHLSHCNESYSKLILKEIANVLKVDIIPEWLSENRIQGSAEYLYNLESIFDDAPNKFLKLINMEDEIKGTKSIFNTAPAVKTKKSNAALKPKFTESAPFLAAILERLSNKTALTCAGSLISSRFVVTAGRCLRSLRSKHNIGYQNETEQYSVVVGTSHPLLEGTIYNVTEVLYSKHNSFQFLKSNITSIVLMKTGTSITMSDTVATVPLANIFNDEASIQFYGWIVGEDPLKADSRTVDLKTFPVTMQSSVECEQSLNYIGMLCLKPTDGQFSNITHLMSGSPVLVLQQNQLSLVAVTQVDSQGALVAYPMKDVSDWLVTLVTE